jgi:hypothetical protein
MQVLDVLADNINRHPCNRNPVCIPEHPLFVLQLVFYQIQDPVSELVIPEYILDGKADPLGFKRVMLPVILFA